jgi:hypothetical protein
MYYLNSFRPLCRNAQGRHAVQQFGLPPFIDASCRREPDFQANVPSISALCRGKAFAPRLHEGDSIAYITVKDSYRPAAFRHWRLIAMLRVVQRFESHNDAAVWYREAGFPLPSNCMVNGNACFPYEMTAGTNRFGNVDDVDELLRRWDTSYRLRTRRNGAFLACEAQFLSLDTPPIVTDADMLHIFGRIPATRTPPTITETEYCALQALALRN